MLFDFILVLVLGGLIGGTELLSRYRDAPFRALRGPSAFAYIFVNMLAAGCALWLTRLFDVTYGIDPIAEAERLRWVQVFSAGFGAMILLRSSVFVLNIGDQSVSIGPSSMLDALLTILDRDVDRRRAEERADAARRIMDGISFRKAREQLPIVAFALMQNLSRDEQDKVVNKVFGLEKQAGAGDRAKAQALGLALMDIVGEKVLAEAVSLIRADIEATELEDALEGIEFAIDEEEPED